MAAPLPSNARPAGPLWALFGFDGRLSRQPFWLGFVFMLLLVSAASTPFTEVSDDQEVLISPIGLVVLLAAVWSQFALATKRLHDRALSGWYCLVLFAPLLVMGTPLFISLATLINIGFFGTIGLLPGTPGPNRFGPGPNRRSQ